MLKFLIKLMKIDKNFIIIFYIDIYFFLIWNNNLNLKKKKIYKN